jgi:2-iminobutanoate/2-iminopropanoate deaminase
MADTPKRIVVEGLGRLPQFSHAVVAGGQVFVSGTLGALPGGFRLAEGGAGPETRQTLANLEAILVASGAGLRDALGARVEIECVAALPDRP